MTARSCTREEVEILHAYRAADAAGKHRMVKTALLALQNKLPSMEQIQAMGTQKFREWIDSMDMDIHIPE